jgi:hypothetical protein
MLPWLLIGTNYILGYASYLVLLFCFWALLRISKGQVRISSVCKAVILYCVLAPVVLHHVIFLISPLTIYSLCLRQQHCLQFTAAYLCQAFGRAERKCFV